MKKYLLILLIIMLLTGCNSVIDNKISSNKNNQNNNMKEDENNMTQNIDINIIINGETFTATLENNETAKELLNRLPLTITMNELNGNEKYYYFDETFPNNSSKIGKINTGDLMLYGNDCLVLFYKTFNTTYTYTRIGKINNIENLENVLVKDNIDVTFTK